MAMQQWKPSAIFSCYLSLNTHRVYRYFLQDDKPEAKKETKVDVEMKVDEPPTSTAPPGDISPITGSVSNLPDATAKADGKAAEVKKPRKAEPSFEKLPNLSRVTPMQLAHITFPSEGRYQPVRPVSTRSAKPSKGKAAAGSKAPPAAAALGIASERYAGGGGILLLIDQRPGEPAELIESEVAPAPQAPPAAMDVAAPEPAPAATAAPSGPNVFLDEDAPEAGPPESFEVRNPDLHD